MGWIRPNSYIDVDGKWVVESAAYDNALYSYAFSTINEYEHWLELHLAEAIRCDKVRLYCSESYGPGQVDAAVRIEVYYDSGWHLVYQGTVTKNQWVEKAIPAGSKNVTAARVYNTYTYPGYTQMRLNEFEFGEAEFAACFAGGANFFLGG